MEKIETVVSKLTAYEKAGKVFHGSTNPSIKILEPRPAKDKDTSNTFNNDKAVFASVSAAASVIFACMSFDNIPKEKRNGSWGIGSINDEGKIVAKIPQKWQEYVSKNEGYVYVLNGESFSGEGENGGGWQVKSKTAVKPIDVVKVQFEDFEKLGGVIVWKIPIGTRLKKLEERTKAIEDRNIRVQIDKKWETSIERKVLIATLTYAIISVFLIVINVDRPFINAIVPTIGFLLSTLSFTLVKSIWIKKSK